MGITLLDLARRWDEFSATLEADPHILVVEDDPPLRNLFSMVLEDSGFTAEVAGSGEAALELLGGDAGNRFDGLLVDKNLPGISGLDLIREAQRLDSDREAVIVTAFANLQSVLAAMDLRASDYLIKPLPDINLLPATFTRALRRRNRRLLARRMLADLRHQVRLHADEGDLHLLDETRQRVDDFKQALDTKQTLLMATADAAALKPGLKAVEARGFRITTAGSARSVISACERGEANVLLLSNNFEGMGYRQLFDVILGIDGRPEIVVTSADDDYAVAVEALNLGASGFITVPTEDPSVVAFNVDRACRDQHERLYHSKLVFHLNRLFCTLSDRASHQQARDHIANTLKTFDVNTRRITLSPIE